jgi:hypothetical protein
LQQSVSFRPAGPIMLRLNRGVSGLPATPFRIQDACSQNIDAERANVRDRRHGHFEGSFAELRGGLRFVRRVAALNARNARLEQAEKF